MSNETFPNLLLLFIIICATLEKATCLKCYVCSYCMYVEKYMVWDCEREIEGGICMTRYDPKTQSIIRGCISRGDCKNKLIGKYCVECDKEGCNHLHGSRAFSSCDKTKQVQVVLVVAIVCLMVLIIS